MSVETTTGPVSTKELGFTSMHEHIACAFGTGMRENYLWPDYSKGREEAIVEATKKMTAAREAGVDTLVDLTTVDLGRDASLIAEVSQRSGMGIVVTTGVFASVPPDGTLTLMAKGLDTCVDLFTRDIEVGIANSSLKAGVLKCAMQAPLIIDADGLTTREGEFMGGTKVLMFEELPKLMWGEFGTRAAARTHLRTGACICVHTHTVHKTGIMALDILEEEGVNLSRVSLHHVGDTQDFDYLYAMLKRNTNINMDPHRGPWQIDVIARLCAEGYADRITLAIDSVQTGDFDPIEQLEGEVRKHYEEEWSLAYLPASVIPQLRAAGVTDADITAMTVTNPGRLLEPAL